MRDSSEIDGGLPHRGYAPDRCLSPLQRSSEFVVSRQWLHAALFGFVTVSACAADFADGPGMAARAAGDAGGAAWVFSAQVAEDGAQGMQLAAQATDAAAPSSGAAMATSSLADPRWVASLEPVELSRPVIFVSRFSSNEKTLVPEVAARGGDAAVRQGHPLAFPRVFLIGAERTLRAGGAIMLAPGNAGELGDLGVPFVRVHVSAPGSAPLNVDELVARRPRIGMFNALFAPAPTRRGDAAATAVAAVVGQKGLATVQESGFESGSKPPSHAYIATSVDPVSVVPVEERSRELRPIPLAAVEERDVLAGRESPLPIDRVVPGTGKPLVGIAPMPDAVALEKHDAGNAVGLIRVGADPARLLVPVAMAPELKPSKAREPDVVKLPVVQKRLPNIMIDRRGGYFFM